MAPREKAIWVHPFRNLPSRGDDVDLTFQELDSSTWRDFERLFSRQGTPSTCWCMYYQRPWSYEQEVKKYSVRKSAIPAHNKGRKRELVAQGRSHGILVYADGQPVGWCQYGPRDEAPRIDRGRYYRMLGLKEEPEKVWRITCFVVDRDFRKQGVASTALKAALASIEKQGGGVVEAYPVTSKKGGSQSMWFGTVGMFEREGFEPVGSLGSSLLMRKVVR